MEHLGSYVTLISLYTTAIYTVSSIPPYDTDIRQVWSCDACVNGSVRLMPVVLVPVLVIDEYKINK